MTTVSEAAVDLELLFPDTPKPYLDRILLRTAQRFCIEARLLRHTATVPNALGGEAVVSFPPPAQMQAYAAEAVSRNGRPLRIAGTEALRGDNTGRAPTSVFVEGGTLYFDGQLEAGDSVEVTAFITLADNAVDLPDVLAREWRDALTAGAAAWLFRAPSGDTYSEQNAAFQEQRFEEFLRRARRQGRNGKNHVKRTVRYGGI